MKMRDAITEARNMGDWHDGETTVIVWFNHNDNTSFDIMDDEDLVQLWEDQFEELGSTIDGVDDVFALGYID